MTDKPRKIVVCSPDEYAAFQRAVTSLGRRDVLVQPNRYVESGKAYVIDGSTVDPMFTTGPLQ